MEVLNSNFSTQLPAIKQSIDNATFLSIDCELTGLHTIFDINAFNTPKEYFEKIYVSSKDYLVIQFGLCTFKYDDTSGRFRKKIYNFYTFPHKKNKWVPDISFLCQASSINFLAKNEFDFNKLFREGITYLNKQSEDAFRQKLEVKNSHSDDNNAKFDVEEEVKKSLGITDLIQYISKSGKLIVGHNMLLDICHTIDKFLTKIPSDFYEFKECVHCLFPCLIDTKYMASTSNLKPHIPSSILGQMHTTLLSAPFPKVSIDEEIQIYEGDSKAATMKQHEAGYDAYITGVCLIAMWQYLSLGEDGDKSSCFNSFEVLRPYMNKIFLMRLQDAPYMNVAGEELSPPRDHVCYLSFPPKWKTNDITELFSPFGNVYVAWINSSSAYISLHNREQAKTAFSTIRRNKTCTLKTFEERQQQLRYIKCTLEGKRKRKHSFTFGTIAAENTVPKRKTNSSPDISSAPCEETVTRVIRTRKPSTSKTFPEDNAWE